MRKLILFTFWILSSVAMGQVTRSMWVGESFTCDVSSSIMGLTSDVSWSTNGGYISFTGTGFYRNVMVTQYFSGVASVTCTWKQRLTASSAWTVRKKTWNFSCRENPVSITPSIMNLSVGESAYVSFRHKYSNSYSAYASPYVQSSNQSVVTVSSSGKVTAVGRGTAYITAYSKLADNGNAPSCKVVVTKVEPTSVSIPTTLIAYVGETTKLGATIYPSNAQTNFSWKSSDESVVSVSSGIVKGLSEGIANVYVVTSNGLRSNDCRVTVKYREPTNVSLSKSFVHLPIGHSMQLEATVSPSNAKYTLIWSSDDNRVAEVSASGYVIAKEPGSACIEVKTDNGYSATCNVIVPPMPEKLELPGKIALPFGKSRILKCSVEPKDAYVSLDWNSNNTDIVIVDQQGKVTACGVGEAIITVTAEGGKEAECKVIVDEPQHCFVVWTKDGGRVDYLLEDHPVVIREKDKLVLTTRNVRVEYPELQVWKYTIVDRTDDLYPTEIGLPDALTLEYKQSLQLGYQLFPTDFDIETELTWQSSASHIVSVDQTGRLLARCIGEAIISVTASNGTMSSCFVNVPDGAQFCLVVWTTGGECVSYPFNEAPVIRLCGGNYTVKTTAVEVEYPVSSVRKFTLTGTDNSDDGSVSAIPAVGAAMGSIADGLLLFSSLQEGDIIHVFNTSGMLLRTVTVSASGCAMVDLGTLPQGIYIVKANNITQKIIKR